MLEILYRIYEVLPEEEKLAQIDGFWLGNTLGNREILMDCCVCDTREQFKDIIRATWGDIPFRPTKKLAPGDHYCVIIGEHCWTTERYFQKKKYVCDHCGAEIEGYYSHPIMLSDSEIRWELYGLPGYEAKTFCSNTCKQRYLTKIKEEIKPSDDQEFWVTRDMLKKEGVIGWIYRITKKSTGEFYVGQTMYCPVFRWGQHLKTARFPLDNLSDYKFEVIQEVKKGQNILEVEKEWIQRCYSEDPERSLNIMQTKNL